MATASFGQELEEWWTRGIEALIEHQGLVFVASIGNGLNASEPPFYPGAGANSIGVGVVSSVNAVDPATKLSHFALAYPQESSAGPTDDGRCKPDVIAPGNCLVADADSNDGYAMAGNWSSFSTPVAAGVVGLLIQTAKQNAESESGRFARGRQLRAEGDPDELGDEAAVLAQGPAGHRRRPRGAAGLRAGRRHGRMPPVRTSF